MLANGLPRQFHSVKTFRACERGKLQGQAACSTEEPSGSHAQASGATVHTLGTVKTDMRPCGRLSREVTAAGFQRYRRVGHPRRGLSKARKGSTPLTPDEQQVGTNFCYCGVTVIPALQIRKFSLSHCLYVVEFCHRLCSVRLLPSPLC